MVQVVYILTFIGNSRIFWKYIESACNWADGASRQLTDDLWATENELQLKEISCAAVDCTQLLQRVLRFPAFFGGDFGVEII